MRIDTLRYIGLAGISGLCLMLSACSSIPGTYSDGGGAFVLDVKSGGEATFTFMGQSAACNYKVQGKTLVLDCKGDAGKTVLTIHDDGSLTGPPGTFMPMLKKTKS